MKKRNCTCRIGINPVYSYIKISTSLQNDCAKEMEIFGVKEFTITADILLVNLRIHAISTVIVKQSERDDELGILLGGLRRMQEALRGTVQTIRSGVEAIASAASEIAAGNIHRSQRTEEQAASQALQEQATHLSETVSAFRLDEPLASLR